MKAPANWRCPPPNALFRQVDEHHKTTPIRAMDKAHIQMMFAMALYLWDEGELDASYTMEQLARRDLAKAPAL